MKRRYEAAKKDITFSDFGTGGGGLLRLKECAREVLGAVQRSRLLHATYFVLVAKSTPWEGSTSAPAPLRVKTGTMTTRPFEIIHKREAWQIEDTEKYTSTAVTDHCAAHAWE